MAGGQPSTSTDTSDSECYASVAAVKFSSNMKVISEYKLKDTKSLVQSMRRHEQGNIIFLGTFSKVEVLFFDGSSFESLAQYGDLNCGPIICMQLLNDDLFCLGTESPSILQLSYSQPFSGSTQTQATATKPSKACVAQFTAASKKVFVQQQALQDWEVSASRQLCVSEGQILLRAGNMSEAAAEGLSSYNMLDKGDTARMIAGGKVVVVNKEELRVFDGGRCTARMQIWSDLGSHTISQPTLFIEKTSHEKESHIFACMIDPGILGIFDIQKLEYDRIKVTSKPEQLVFKNLLIAPDGSKILGVCESSNLKEQTMLYWQKTELMAPATRPMQYFSEKLREVQALAATNDIGIFIVAGTLLDGKPALLAGSFDGYFDQLAHLEILDSPTLHSLKRLGNSDFFFTGGVGRVHVILLQNKSALVEVFTIKDLKMGPILKMELCPSTNLWLLEKEGHKIAQVAFGKPLDKLTL